MINPSTLKEYLKPTQVVEHYLGSPIKRNHIGLWYKSPFRKERTASFCVNDNKGIHDFGTSEHYDIIGFVEEYYKVDFRRAMDILKLDFGISDDEERTSTELVYYLRQRRKEEKQIQKIIEGWYNQTLSKLCDELIFYKKAIRHLNGEALSIAYFKEQYLDYLIDNLIEHKEEKEKLYKERKAVEKWTQLR